MGRIRVLLSSVMAFALLSSTALPVGAAPLSEVKVRGSDKNDYSRIVFDWKKLPQYTARMSDDKVVLKFSGQADFVKDAGEGGSFSKVLAYKVISPDTVEVAFPKGATVRHFVIDNRLVIDVNEIKPTQQGASKLPKEDSAHDKPSEEHKAGTEKKSSEEKHIPEQSAKTEALKGKAEPISPAPQKAPQKDPQKAAGDNQDNQDKEEKAVESKDVGGVPVVEETPRQEEVSVQIVINTTSTVPVVSFVRNGYLWVVEDRLDTKLPPQITVAGGGQFESFQRVPQDGMSVFRVKIPSGVPLAATGGGLVWKIDLGSSARPEHRPLELKRLFGGSETDKGPSLLWPAQSLHRIAEIKDPDAGDTIYVGFVQSAQDFIDSSAYVDLAILPSPIGFAAVAKVDDLKISRDAGGLLIARPEGLSLSSDKDIHSASDKEETGKENTGEISRVFDFAQWRIGTEKDLSDNQRLMMSGMVDQTETKKAETLIDLGKLMLSFGYAPEAIGYLDLAQSIVPEMETNPEFISLKGAAKALSWKHKEAFQDFSSAGVQDVGEIPYWKAFALAKLDDWQQAAKILPKDVSVLGDYPDEIRSPVALTLAEVALREGNIAKAKAILTLLEPAHENMTLPYKSAYEYLTGELNRQMGKTKEAKEIWEELTKSNDDLYRAKSRFALATLQLGTKEITPDKAIDELEGLRYAWRGDDLEVAINYNLAKIYLEKGEPVKALTLMKLARSLNPLSEQGKKIDVDMRDVFKKLFAADRINSLNPVDVLTVYNEFSDLIPAGAEGEALTRQLVERLANVDLLPRAITLLKKQVDSGALQGLEGATVVTRLAALETMDGRAEDALRSLDKAEGYLKDLPAEEVLPKQRDIGLLRAKAYSLKGMPDDAFSALSLLPQDDATLRLRADIAWRAKKWQEAADALEQLVQNQNISLTRPLTDEQADMILNWAVALYLADNRYVLANVRERFSDAMAATSKAQKFDVVTRPRQAALLADRETINSIIDETVIFKDFLKSFKAGDPVPTKQAPTAPESAQSATEASAETSQPADVPENLRNVPGLKVDDVLGD